MGEDSKRKGPWTPWGTKSPCGGVPHGVLAREVTFRHKPMVEGTPVPPSEETGLLFAFPPRED